jgi:hypothetical protein
MHIVCYVLCAKFDVLVIFHARFCLTILRHIFFMISYEQIRRVDEKEDIFENSELNCFCKILGSGNFLQVVIFHVILFHI